MGRESIPDDVVKHLEMIQSVVTRMASNSFVVKGWTLTVSAILYGFAVNGSDWRLALVGILIGATFWFLDSYYLRQERMYRCLFDEVRTTGNDVPPYSLNARKYHTRVSRVGALFSTTLISFYLMPTAIGVALIIVIITTKAPIAKK